MRSLSWRLTLRIIAVLSWILTFLWFFVEPESELVIPFLEGVAVYLASLTDSDAPLDSKRIVLRIIAILAWVVAVPWFVVEPGFEPLATFLGGAVIFLGEIYSRESKPTDERRIQRNRRTMLGLVRRTWVKDVLEQSLHGAAMIELGLEERANAVERPWDMLLQRPNQPKCLLPHGTKIVDVFDEMNTLLILGAPGSGKTTTLLELARELIARAEGDPTQPIPVVFNLSSWSDPSQPIAEWLVDELNAKAKYNIPRKIARSWVENDELLLLLDGLDEAKSLQKACVKAINDFRQEHGLTPLVVCSRIADYEALTTRLKLQGALILQPLTPQQVDEYLEGTGIELLAVRRTLQHDTRLQELVQTPLMLSIMTLAYQRMSVKDLGLLDSIETRRRCVFDAYTQRMLERRRGNQRYGPEQTIRWLAWLAQKMSQHYQPAFSIEIMEPSWLQTDAQRRLYTIISNLIGGLIGGLILGLVGGLIGGLTFGLILGLVGGLISGLHSQPTRLSKPTRTRLWEWVSPPSVVESLMLGLILVLFFGLNQKLLFGLLYGLLFASAWSNLILNSGPLSEFEHVRRLENARRTTRTLSEFEHVRRLENARRTTRRLWDALIAGGLIVGIGMLSKEVMFGLILGMNGRLDFGSLAVVKRFALRFTLYLNGHIPWNYARFLDYAAECIFLRKVGGGYIFIHRLLQDYFAALGQSQ